MTSLFRWASRLTRWAPAAPRTFPSHGCVVIPESLKIEEETLPDYVPGRYYPVRIGEVLASRYQVVGKLGYGMTSTVWLAKDLTHHRHVAIKIFVRSAVLGNRVDRERNVYQRITNGPRRHPGRAAVRSLLDVFQLSGPDGEYQCLVHPPLWENIQTFLARNPIGRLPNPVLAIVLQRLFQALDYLHNECGVIHTDIKSDSIMFGFRDDLPLEEFEQAELASPSPRKEVDGRVVYVSRQIQQPSRLGAPVLCDFGAAFFGDKLHENDIQPDQYRCPEVILKVPWSYKVDIWSIGCMVWDIFEGHPLFSGQDPELGVYRGRAHLAEMIALLEPPSPEFLNRGKLKSKFFSESGEWQARIDLLPRTTLEKLETNLEGPDKEQFLQLMDKMLRWAPEDRQSARELLTDPWVIKQLGG